MNEPVFSPKTLFIDEPFSTCVSLRAQRSRFIWSILSQHTDADLLILKSAIYRDKPIPPHADYDHLYSLGIDEPGNILPKTYHALGNGQRQRFEQILDGKRYQIVILAGWACLPLLPVIKRVLPSCLTVIDVEQVPSPSLIARWRNNPNWDNISTYLNLHRQKASDWYLLRSKPHFIIHNPGFISLIPHNDNQKCLFAPLPLPETSNPTPSSLEPPFILYWGLEPSEANISAAKTIVGDIYPYISRRMVEKNISLILCGTEQLKDMCGGRIHYAPPEDLDKLLSQALFAVLPISLMDDENRVLTCASRGKALVCHSQLVQGYHVPDDAFLASDDPKTCAEHILNLLKAPHEIDKIAARLAEHHRQNYTTECMEHSVIATLQNWMESHDK